MSDSSFGGVSRRQFVEGFAGVTALGVFAGPLSGLTARDVSAQDGHDSDAVARPRGRTTWVVDQQRDTATDDGPGTQSRPLKSISEAANRAQPGDTVLVHAGVYRERVAPRSGGTADSPIVYAAAEGEHVVIKGSTVWTPQWQAVAKADGVCFGRFTPDLFKVDQRQAVDWPGTFPAEYNPYTIVMAQPPGGFHLTIGQLFLGAAPMRQVDRKTDLYAQRGSWMVAPNAAGLYVNFGMSPTEIARHVVELTVRPRCFAPYKRGLAYIEVRGFHMEHGATNFPDQFWAPEGQPQAGILGTRGGHHWTIENNTVRYANTIGIDIGTEGSNDADGLGQPEPAEPTQIIGRHMVRNNIVSDNGSNGIVGYQPRYSQILDNEIERNNTLGFTAYEIGGIKVHAMTGGLIAGNLIRENYCSGIWLDQTFTDIRVTRNALISNQGQGLMIELGIGPALVDNNVIALTRPGAFDVGAGDGCYAQDAAGVTFVHNLLFQNAGHGLWFHYLSDRVDADGNEVRASNWSVRNNIFARNAEATQSFPIESPRSTNNSGDHNVFTQNRQQWMAATPVPVFTVNLNAGLVPLDNLVALFEQKLDENNVPEQMRPGLERWREVRYVRLDEWRWLTGSDSNSLAVGAAGAGNDSTLAPESTLLKFTIDASPAGVNATPIKGVDTDYFGNPIPRKPLAGPFQSLVLDSVSPNFLYLWPRAAGL